MLSKADAAFTAAVILGTARKDPDEGTSEAARAAGTAAREQSSERVPAPYRSWYLQRAFIAGWNDADVAAKTEEES